MSWFGGREQAADAPTSNLVAKRNAVARWTALAMFGVLAITLAATTGRQSTMPGPLAAAHGSQAKCETCHADIGRGSLSWWRAIFPPADPHRNAKACMTCHKIERAAFAPHGVDRENLKRRTTAREKTAALVGKPLVANLRDYLLPSNASRSNAIFCATCHDEHQGRTADITKVSDARCQACHVVQFDDFTHGHPVYRSYPFRRRTPIQFDHAQHFAKNFPDAIERKRNIAKAPAQCMDCHELTDSSGRMALKPFSQTCSSCHQRQLLGHERASGPKGVVFLALPGLDVETLEQAGLNIGDWPGDAEAEIPPLMAVLIGIDSRRRKLVDVVRRLDLLDLSKASKAELQSVAAFAWEVKILLRELITSPTSHIEERIEKAIGAAMERRLAVRLIAALPRDILFGFQRQWLPNLSTEVDDYVTRSGARLAGKKKSSVDEAGASSDGKTKKEKSSNTGRKSVVRSRNEPTSGRWRINPNGELVKGDEPAEQQGQNSERGERNSEQGEKAESETETNTKTESEPATESKSAAAQPRSGQVSPEVDLAVDGESWATFGGWYRRDFAILYRPTRHDDAFMVAWLNATGRALAGPRSVANIAKPAFDYLAAKDAVGQCTKCHSVDDVGKAGRQINWQPSLSAIKKSRFTRFSHAPHFGVVGEEGCLTCHALAETGPTKTSYKDGNPLTFVSNFRSIDKKTCDGCHNRSGAPQDCTLCHNYHVTKVRSPAPTTRLPAK